MEIDKEINHFYYSFKSSDDLKTHPNNNTEDFRITLKENIRLEGEWEVGLSSIFLPHINNYKFQSIFKILLHIPPLPYRNPLDDKYWISITLSSSAKTFIDIYLDLKKKIEEAITKVDSSLKVADYIVFNRGSNYWWPNYRIKWGTIILISTDLATFFNMRWRGDSFIKVDHSEATYGLRQLNQEDQCRNILQLKGTLWVTLNPSKSRNNLFIRVLNNKNVVVELINLKKKDAADKKLNEKHTDKMYHNTILVKTNLIKAPINLQKSEYKNIIRVVALPQRENEIENHQFDFLPIFYFPLRVNILNTIKVKLKRFKMSDIVDHITFNGDTSIVILHFRKRHSIL